jgi:hypothetical protein
MPELVVVLVFGLSIAAVIADYRMFSRRDNMEHSEKFLMDRHTNYLWFIYASMVVFAGWSAYMYTVTLAYWSDRAKQPFATLLTEGVRVIESR